MIVVFAFQNFQTLKVVVDVRVSAIRTDPSLPGIKKALDSYSLFGALAKLLKAFVFGRKIDTVMIIIF